MIEERTFNLPSGPKTVCHGILSMILFDDFTVGIAEGRDWLLDKMPSIVRYEGVFGEDDFSVKNRRRHQLITKKLSGEATTDELEELDHLRQLIREHLCLEEMENIECLNKRMQEMRE